uniref:Uncharacterized protein n=1 Tax=Arundo donax TaxID=35708 RepID=A0A0A8Z4G7_ARUDO
MNPFVYKARCVSTICWNDNFQNWEFTIHWYDCSLQKFSSSSLLVCIFLSKDACNYIL